jgi:hypothetical protein
MAAAKENRKTYHGTIEEVLLSLGMVKGYDPTGRLSFF